MRDTAQSGRDGKERLLNRRAYVTAVGGAVGAALGVGTAAARGRGANGSALTQTTSNDSANDGSGGTGESSGNDSSTPAVGGGEGYENTVAPAAATVTATTKSELNDALLEAESGDVVYVDGNAEIDMGTSQFRVPGGVTLASDRGIDGSEGALLETEDRPWGMLKVGSDARITGIRVGGPRWEWIENVGGELGIDVAGDGVEIDNCEVYGWGYASVKTADDTHVHHSHIHHNPKDGTGYGVSTGGSTNPLVEYNEFSNNRHSVASSSGGYVARYNHVKQGAISHVFDQHKPGGTTIEIYNNTVEAVENAMKDKLAPAVAIRGTPSDVADIHDNWFHNPKEPRDDPSGWTEEAIIQVHTNDWNNVEFENNHYGTDEPSDDVGHPR